MELYNLQQDRVDQARRAGWWPEDCLIDLLRRRVVTRLPGRSPCRCR